ESTNRFAVYMTIDKFVPNCGDVIRFLKSKKRSFSLYSKLHIELNEGLKTLGYITFTLSFFALLGRFHGEQTEALFTTLAFLNLISIATLLLGPQPFQKDLLENYEK
uniref:hypothetical protein n=1 Tax=Flammeovirga sp. OC4 TaxID=1382345 RepID=UPI0005C43C78